MAPSHARPSARGGRRSELPMSLYVLDTDIMTLLQALHPTVNQRYSAHSPNDVGVTVITVEERLSGWYRCLRQANKRDKRAAVYQQLAESVRALAGRPILSFTEPAMIRYEQLRALKLNIGKPDLCIAAITLENNGI